MFSRKVIFSVVGVVLLVVAFFLYITPRVDVHTFYEKVFSENIDMQSFEEKIITISLENMTRYGLFLGAPVTSNVNVSFTILDPNKDELSVFDFRDHGDSVESEFITTTQGNYTIHITEQTQDNSYTAYFSVSERIDEYYATGGKYTAINNLLKNIQATFIAIVGIAFILTAFWKDLKKLTQTTQNNMRVHLSN
jgi:hypothetical protein